ncbi:MAG TPA: hypothetical protein VHT05_13675, partial [Candidatus Elarobacter sp.]|nr:hypothetical protein [Candidatus Elarobacter sp.]
MRSFGLARTLTTTTVLALAVLGAAPPDAPSTVPLTLGTLVRSQFVVPSATVQVESAVFPRDAIVLRLVDLPLGWPPGENVRRAIGPGVIAAIDGGFTFGRNHPDGLFVLGGVIRQPASSDYSGIVGTTNDGTLVVDYANAVDPRTLRDGVQAGPFLID